MELETNLNDLDVLNVVVTALKRLESEERDRVLQMVLTYFGAVSVNTGTAAPAQSASFKASFSNDVSFSEDRSMSPKSFIMQKQPRTDVERVACLAYYLTH